MNNHDNVDKVEEVKRSVVRITKRVRIQIHMYTGTYNIFSTETNIIDKPNSLHIHCLFRTEQNNLMTRNLVLDT